MKKYSIFVIYTKKQMIQLNDKKQIAQPRGHNNNNNSGFKIQSICYKSGSIRRSKLSWPLEG